MTKERQITIALLKEKLQKLTGKKVLLEFGKTYLMATDSDANAKIVKAIALLKSIDLDGETMQFIIEQLGMKSQMRSQLSGEN